MVLVILIALWAMVLLPPYLKDRRASNRTFRSIHSTGVSAGGAQRFLPLQKAATGYATSAVASPTGMRASGASSLGSLSASNVVPLRPAEPYSPPHTVGRPVATTTTAAPSAYNDEAAPVDESILHQVWEGGTPGVGIPRSTAAARERRRQVLLALTAVAFGTLLLALFAGGSWVAAHVLVDVAMVGYVILLVRHRQLAADRMLKVEPIRPPVSETMPAHVQIAPSYLLQSNTGS